MRLIDVDETVKYLQEFRCKDCDRRKGMKNGKIQFCYEIGDAPCRACDIGDVIDYFIDEDISPTIDAVQVVRCRECKYCGSEIRDGTKFAKCELKHNWMPQAEWFCADGERKEVK